MVSFWRRRSAKVHTFSWRRDKTPVYTLGNRWEEPDPEWVFVDAAGHEHKWDRPNGVTNSHKVQTGTSVFDDGDGYWDEVPHFELRCNLCEEPLEPGYRYQYGPKFIQGPIHYYVDDQPVTKAEYDAAREETQHGDNHISP